MGQEMFPLEQMKGPGGLQCLVPAFSLLVVSVAASPRPCIFPFSHCAVPPLGFLFSIIQQLVAHLYILNSPVENAVDSF